MNANKSKSGRKQTRQTSIERKISRYVHDPIRLETGAAAESIANLNIKAVRLG